MQYTVQLLDFHAHILPHMDHGSSRTATAHGQLELIHAAGVSEVCATSHFYPQSTLPDRFLSERAMSRERLLSTYGERPRPRLLMGAEVLICPRLEEMEGLRELCVEGTNVLLLEMPFTNRAWDRELYSTVREIRNMGILPVLAHVDRYPRANIERLFGEGMVGQLNATSLDRWIKPRHLLRWIDEGYIVALGSDLHGSDPVAYRPFEKFVHSNPSAVQAIMARTHDLLKDAVRY